ncbi:NAD(P)(+) transhydrogenase (Re/Si-specific) subunit beta [Candidatus Uabimicrobium amorphum]|uniref:NAD(P) transhydrogenase subunit beta n=1 Tax=Uabimicrobium amorphum TaxID=2596890 RepID=A0A5S9ITN1_UABAM|nr:NAD(P)(+) transhydrogenase (Re/Si-specific) subunit beta [Candidatus Uabimicrobium amorphum]BBM87943.1 NAD(P) transhydrogenase subunit beta [Candidatus Uabimicrobium amorphum]
MNAGLIELSYIVAAILFIFGLKMMSSPATARKGNFVSFVGMLIAIVATFLYLPQLAEAKLGTVTDLHYDWIAYGMIAGTIIGLLAARLIAMTSMPEMVALLNGFGGISSLLVGWAVYQYDVVATIAIKNSTSADTLTLATIFLSVLIGGVTFSGSLIAWAKLKEVIGGKPTVFPGQHILNILLVAGAVTCAVMITKDPTADIANYLFWGAIGISVVLGVFAVIPIGGADMPVVISLMNSYSGLAACAAGFVVKNNILIVSGALVGASGVILTVIMCKAMNRSLSNVLFSGFGGASSSGGKAVEGEAKAASPEDAYYVLESASSVVFVPGYGLAVAQAQHVARELGELLEENGAEVSYAIHPVAGRMPGHMNVLLAEANVSYDQLIEMDDINPNIENIDVAIVVGANDVVNPAARDDETSPIYGMPIINVDKARTVYVLKRGMGMGFAGIQNPLFFKENTRMIFGDAKGTIQSLVDEFKN